MAMRFLPQGLLVFAVLACSPAPPVSVPPQTPSTAPAEPRELEEPPRFHGGVAPKVDASLPARSVFFGNPERTRVKLSPDGIQLAFLAPKDGVLNVYVGPLESPDTAKPVTDDKKRGIRVYAWAYTNQHILYLQDHEGDENWRLHAVDLKSGTERDLTPIEGARAELVAVSHKRPRSVAVALNDRDARFHDLYTIDIESGERTLVHENTQGFAGYVVDDEYRLRLALRFTEAGGLDFMVPAQDEFKPVVSVAPEDSMTTEPLGLNARGDQLYLRDSRDRNLAALVQLDLSAAARGPAKAKLLFEGNKADVSDVMLHPTKKTVQAAAVTFERKTWHSLDPGIQGDLSELERVTQGDFDIVSRSLDDQRWIVADRRDDGPLAYYRYDRNSKNARLLFVDRPELEPLSLAHMHPRVIRSRDGQDLVSYLTLPPRSDADADGLPERPLPMVLVVHGGPWARDDWGYNAYHQWLASRGYAVLSVNFRGSLGFGKQFVNLADKEWGAKMHDDLIDAVRWAVDSKIADAQRVAIFGGSYGGYSVLVGLTQTPTTFACGVDIVGPSNLVTLLENIPPYWQPFAPILKQRVGDPSSPEGRRFLLERSPLTHAERIQRPLLIAQGANDPRVKQSESDQIVEAMRSKNIPVVYALYADEGHGFARPENRLSFTALSEVFLAQCLGGPYQPFGSDLKGSSLTVPVGADHIWGLPDALAAP